MFLSGTLLNIATMLLGTSLGLLAGARVPRRMQESLTTGLGFFTLIVAASMALRIFTDPAARPGYELAVLAALLLGVALRLLELKPVRVANFLPALVLAPFFVRLADAVRGWLG